MIQKNGKFQKVVDTQPGSFVIANRNGVSFHGFFFGWGEDEDLDMYIVNLDDLNAVPYAPSNNDRLFVLNNCKIVVDAKIASTSFVVTNANAGSIAMSADSDYLVVNHNPGTVPIDMGTGLVHIAGPIGALGLVTSWKLVQTRGNEQTTITEFPPHP
ncbi:hypothetical protein [Phyllobacterium chamaecytisi]|uniref:hypothetical protein n=1 Tax=Phyllobacterium chamaecytisi TaxID=2876082 RepID=UPI001CCCE501|nr:hypothetical protein [Phyllobacterium sp. KW56]MBZ9601815.1 hypothetical protein [Phyllobacterium sp. KW56]